MRGKVITSALLTVVLSCSSVYGSEAFDNMSTSEQAQTAGAYIGNYKGYTKQLLRWKCYNRPVGSGCHKGYDRSA